MLEERTDKAGLITADGALLLEVETWLCDDCGGRGRGVDVDGRLLRSEKENLLSKCDGGGAVFT